jgi:predicted ATP-dependent serine protease
MTSFAEITPLAPEWIWQDRILAGEVTLLAGAGGCGKSFLAAELSARVTTGRAMPDGSPGQPGSVILVNLEDDAAMSTIHRLRAAHADLARVHDGGSDFELPGSIPALRQQADQIGDVRLVIVDTLSAVTSVSLSGAITVRRQILKPLQAFAHDTGIAVLVICHLVKSGSVAGSHGLVDGVRCVLSVTRNEADPRIRELTVAKSNVASQETKPLRYTLAGEGLQAAVAWLWDENEATGPAQSRLLMALHASSRPLSPQELASLTKVPYATVRVLLHKLTRRGLVESPGRGLYSPAA